MKLSPPTPGCSRVSLLNSWQVTKQTRSGLTAPAVGSKTIISHQTEKMKRRLRPENHISNWEKQSNLRLVRLWNQRKKKSRAQSKSLSRLNTLVKMQHPEKKMKIEKTHANQMCLNTQSVWHLREGKGALENHRNMCGYKWVRGRCSRKRYWGESTKTTTSWLQHRPGATCNKKWWIR